MKLVIMSIGISGAGKTTTLAPLVEQYGILRINRDEIRKEWFGDPLLQENKEAVWREADKRMKEALAAGQPVLLDSTFAERNKNRREVIASARASGAERVIGILFTVPLETALLQNSMRDEQEQVKEEVIRRMHTELTETPPTLEEGFDAIYTHEQLEELIANEFPPLAN
jgi:predicted kinase